jgi:hypothetical protein
MKKRIRIRLWCAIAIFAVGCLAGIELLRADVIVTQSAFKKQSGKLGSCPGAYNGYTTLTNSSGSWFSPPTNPVPSSCTVTDTTGLGTNFRATFFASRLSDGNTWCATNSLTIPVTNTDQYQFIEYITSPVPPPTNGQTLSYQLNWQ